MTLQKPKNCYLGVNTDCCAWNWISKYHNIHSLFTNLFRILVKSHGIKIFSSLSKSAHYTQKPNQGLHKHFYNNSQTDGRTDDRQLTSWLKCPGINFKEFYISS